MIKQATNRLDPVAAINGRFTSENYYDNSLLETENFRVVPTLGSLVEGWVLIIPKEHSISFSEVNQNLGDELNSLKQLISKMLLKQYGHCSIFEHGARAVNTIVGCGVDYAHIHLVPVKIDLLNVIKFQLELDYEWKNCGSVKEVLKLKNEKSPYLYYESENCEPVISMSNNIPSQLFRQAIATSLNTPGCYDWKKFPYHENIAKTIQMFANYQVEVRA